MKTMIIVKEKMEKLILKCILYFHFSRNGHCMQILAKRKMKKLRRNYVQKISHPIKS